MIYCYYLWYLSYGIRLEALQLLQCYIMLCTTYQLHKSSSSLFFLWFFDFLIFPSIFQLVHLTVSEKYSFVCVNSNCCCFCYWCSQIIFKSILKPHLLPTRNLCTNLSINHTFGCLYFLVRVSFMIELIFLLHEMLQHFNYYSLDS